MVAGSTRRTMMASPSLTKQVAVVTCSVCRKRQVLWPRKRRSPGRRSTDAAAFVDDCTREDDSNGKWEWWVC